MKMETGLIVRFFDQPAGIMTFTSLFSHDSSSSPEKSAVFRNGKRLIRSVILGRHGIRSPKESDAALRQWSTRAWPTWPGNQGDLTERGKELIRAQWTAMKPFLASNGLIPARGLPKSGEYALIADEDQRTRMSAIAMFDGLFPGCHIRPQYGSRYDLLFHPDSAVYRTMDRQKALAEVQALLDPLDIDPAIGQRPEYFAAHHEMLPAFAMRGVGRDDFLYFTGLAEPHEY